MPIVRVLKAAARVAGLRRQDVAAARMRIERHGLATVGRRRRRPGGRILAYHTVGQPEWGVNDVSPEMFRRHIELATSLGYRFVSPQELALTGGSPQDLAITFDDGMKSVFTHAAPILREYALPYAFFPVTEWTDQKVDWIADKVMTWDEVGELLEEGAEVGSHSATHPDFGKIGRAQMTDELQASRQMMQARLGFSPKTFAIPLGQSMNWTPVADAEARTAGYEVVYAQAEETRPPETIARTFVTRFDEDRIFKALLKGKFDSWEEWY
ncbi:polysaccharide deacetylase family protein [Phenylobacterium sp.]|uniref:polysaccharide deacetylase family protein n=1 Tax=Phenylobacterium sp. TaxID=1871053 RepID=UPI0035B078DF